LHDAGEPTGGGDILRGPDTGFSAGAETRPMTSGRWTRPLTPFVLALASYAALPSLEWCPFRWSECAAACDVAALPGCPRADAPCERVTACSSEPACAGAPASCDPEQGPIPLDERAWCIHPPFDGVVVRDIGLQEPSASGFPAIPVPLVDLDVPRAPPDRTLERTPLPPALAARHAPPLSRAPPSA
jgi:hypothetical protein